MSLADRSVRMVKAEGVATGVVAVTVAWGRAEARPTATSWLAMMFLICMMDDVVVVGGFEGVSVDCVEEMDGELRLDYRQETASITLLYTNIESKQPKVRMLIIS